jgi:hypothetical protein
MVSLPIIGGVNVFHQIWAQTTANTTSKGAKVLIDDASTCTSEYT